MPSSNSEPQVTVSLTNFNTGRFLKPCLESIYETCGGINFEVIVVDNASTDGSQEMVEREFPRVRLIKNETDLGFGRANNRAIRIARGKYILILSSDTLLLPQALARLIKHMDDNPSLGVVAPKLLNPDNSLQKSISVFPTLKRECLSRLPGLGRNFDVHNFDHNKPQMIQAFTGACYLVRKSVIEQIGSFDEDFYLYVEETEWFYRMKRRGIPIYYLPEAQVIHYGGASTKSSLNRSAMYYKSLILFFKKAYGLPAALLLRMIAVLGSLASFIKLPLLVISPNRQLRAAKIEEARLSWEVFKISVFYGR